MNLHLIFTALVLICMCLNLALNIMPELRKNILNFGYGANFKYKGMLAHSFHRFYVITKFKMPKIEDLKLKTFSFDLTCNYLNTEKTSMQQY